MRQRSLGILATLAVASAGLLYGSSSPEYNAVAAAYSAINVN